jgi:hypothetical protein
MVIQLILHPERPSPRKQAEEEEDFAGDALEFVPGCQTIRSACGWARAAQADARTRVPQSTTSGACLLAYTWWLELEPMTRVGAAAATATGQWCLLRQ